MTNQRQRFENNLRKELARISETTRQFSAQFQVIFVAILARRQHGQKVVLSIPSFYEPAEFQLFRPAWKFSPHIVWRSMPKKTFLVLWLIALPAPTISELRALLARFQLL